VPVVSKRAHTRWARTPGVAGALVEAGDVEETEEGVDRAVVKVAEAADLVALEPERLS
jgi:hypothetical protein